MTEHARPAAHDPELDWLLFDVGGVLITHPYDLAEIAAALGDDRPDAPARIRAAFDAHRRAYDRGATASWYWAAVAEQAGSPVPTAAVIDRLVQLELARWSAPDPATLAALARWRDAGHRLAILSNAPHELADLLDGPGWGRLFEVIMTSARLGLSKPDTRIWPVAADRLGAAPERIAFVDDRPENVAAAARAGFQAHVWEGILTIDRILTPAHP